mgnify:CR=1 FL=1
MFVVLRVITGPRQGEVFRLDRDETFVVGRSRQAHLRFAQDDPYFSQISRRWSEGLRGVFASLPNPDWLAPSEPSDGSPF